MFQKEGTARWMAQKQEGGCLVSMKDKYREQEKGVEDIGKLSRAWPVLGRILDFILKAMGSHGRV